MQIDKYKPNAEKIAISIVIRTLNEAKYLEELLIAIDIQETFGLAYEVILVDSGSTDGTIKIAENHGCQIYYIERLMFSFGRSLNIGCNAAQGDIVAIISGHCVPTDNKWLLRLCQPILDGKAGYTYGRQIGGPDSHFSEHRIFAKYYPEDSCDQQKGFFCNNANAAVHRTVWEKFRFDEDLTGLEDMEFAKRYLSDGGKIIYAIDAVVNHYHYETWIQIRRRYEREAIALQKIMPQLHINIFDTIRYILISVWKDWCYLVKSKGLPFNVLDVTRYRWNQYFGAYSGNNEHRKLSRVEKEKYFYPN